MKNVFKGLREFELVKTSVWGSEIINLKPKNQIVALV